MSVIENDTHLSGAVTSKTNAGRNILSADVGGTHARLAIVDVPNVSDRRAEIISYHKYSCADFIGLEELIEFFLEGHLVSSINGISIATAGYLSEGRVINSNLKWGIEVNEIKKKFGFDAVNIINDFYALAYGIDHIDANVVEPLNGELTCNVSKPVLIIGAGTGFGASIRVPDSDGHLSVLDCEAGQISFAPSAAIELKILKVLMPENGHIPMETILSGPGLLTVYETLCQIHDRVPLLAEPADVADAARAQSDAIAMQTMDVFCGALGSMTADLVLASGASGGVYLAGGVLSRLSDIIRHNASFMTRFLNKGTMGPYLKNVPISLVEHGQLAVLGAAVDWKKKSSTEAFD